MEIEFTSEAKKDLEYWKKSGNSKVLNVLGNSSNQSKKHLLMELANPEALKFDLAGKWSRRINKADRIIYTITDSIIYINSLKGHYD